MHLVESETDRSAVIKNVYLFLERCRKSNMWLRALMHSDCLHSSLFFENYNRISLCEWVIELCSVCLQRRSQNEAEEAMALPRKQDFSLVFYINLNCSKTNGRNSRTHVVLCSLTDQGLRDFLRLDAKLYD